MSEQLSYQLYKWLSSVGVVPTSLRYKTNGNYELEPKTAENLKSGFLLAKLLQILAKEHAAAINEPLVGSVKQSNTPAAKTYNWNILAESFTKLNVTLDKQSQKEITAGNFNTLVRFLLELHKRFNPKKEPRRQESGQAEINLKRLEVLQSYEQAESVLELSVMVISHSLSLTPKQALSTLGQNCKYYAHMVVKGIKNGFGQVLSMLGTFTEQLPRLMFLCEKNPQRLTEFLLDLIKPTLISRDSEVAKKGCQTFQKLLYESLNYNSKNLVYQILCKESVGFDFLYMGLKRHPDLVHQFTSFLFLLIRDAFKDFFEIHLKRTINNEQEYLKIVLRIVEGLTANPQSKTALKQSGLLNVWLKNSELSFERRKNKEENPVNEQTKILYLELLCNLWKHYAAEVDQQYAEQLLIKGIEELKRNTRKDIYTIKVPALLRLFDFLHFLADSKNKVAPMVYKKLIFLLIENHQEEETRELILANFRVMLQKYPTIPIEFLVEPLLRQLANSEGQSYLMNVFDFEFLIELCKHPRMDAANALSYLQFLSKLYIKSFIYAKLTIRVIEVLSSRFCEEETIVEFMKKNIESTLNLYEILTFNKTKLSKEENIMNKQKKSLAIELIKHFTHLEHQELAQFIKEKVVGLFLLWADTKKHLNKGLKYIIELYGDLEELCMQYRVKESRRQELSRPISSEATFKQSRLAPQTEVYQELQYMKERGMGYKIAKKANTEDLAQRNLLKANPAALQHLQKMKERLKGEASRKREIADIQLKKLKEKNNVNSLELLQRNLSLGYAKLVPASEDQTLFEFGTVKPKQLKLAYHFHSLQELETIDKQSTKAILKHYAKDIKSIFMKYALISSTHQSKRKDQSAPVMSFTEVVKMLNEKGMSEVNKFVVSDVIAAINYSKRKERNVLFGIEEPEFAEFLIKITDFIIQNEQNSQEVPFGLRLQKVIKGLLANQVFYQNRLRIKQDAQIGKLRQALKSSQAGQLQVPQGYRKVKQTQVGLIYVPADRDWGVAQKFCIGYELADWLISKCLDLHVMTPCVEIKQRYNLIQIPKPIKLKIPKQETDPKIKYDPEDRVQQNEFLQDAKIMTPGKLSESSPQKERDDRRSHSQRAIHKAKMGPAVLVEEEKQKVLKREKYVLQLKQNLQKLRQEKSLKQQAKKVEETEKREKERKKEEERKQYISSSKQKVDQFRRKQAQEKVRKQKEDKSIKEAALQERKKREKDLFQKHQEDIKKRADVLSERRKELQSSKDRKAKQFQKLAKESVTIKQEVQQQKLRMLQIKNSLQNGELKTIVNQHQKEFKQLYSSYFNWDKNKIELNAIALLLRDFQISPELVLPKTIADVYKSSGKGQALDFQGFIQCLTKCAYKSPKFQAEESNVAQGINPRALKKLIQKLKMAEDNYKEVVKIVKNHLQ